jgi:hypothetical protein
MLLASAKEAVPKRRLHGYVTLAGAAECEAASGIKNMESAPRVFNRPNQEWAFPVSELAQISLTGHAPTFLFTTLRIDEQRRSACQPEEAWECIALGEAAPAFAVVKSKNIQRSQRVFSNHQSSASGSPATARCCSPRPALSQLPALCSRRPSRGIGPTFSPCVSPFLYDPLSLYHPGSSQGFVYYRQNSNYGTK